MKVWTFFYNLYDFEHKKDAMSAKNAVDTDLILLVGSPAHFHMTLCLFIII